MNRALHVLLFALLFAAVHARADTTPVPSVSGPITGPGEVYPGLQRVPAGTGLSDHKYVIKEYFVSGNAAGKPYTTRILIRQPEDPKKFSGVVVAEPMHSSGNSWMFYFTRLYVMTRGHISVEIAPQKAATEQMIVASSPARYAKISIPDIGQANEIIAQVGALLKSNQAHGPLPGLQVRRVFLMGTSQSAGQVRAYLSVHAQYRLANGGPIYDGFLPTSNGGNTVANKVDVPVIQVPTQTEVTAGAANGNLYRRPDGDEPGNQFRLYEMAGMPHNDSRENPTYEGNPCKIPVTTFPVGSMMAMALHNLVEWADHGKVPPRADRVTVDSAVKKVSVDAFGNAEGGVRNTYVDIPVAKFTIPNSADPKPGSRADFYCTIAGGETPLSTEQLRSLYKNHKEYRSRVERRLKLLITEGWFLPEYSSQVLGDAEKVRVP